MKKIFSVIPAPSTVISNNSETPGFSPGRRNSPSTDTSRSPELLSSGSVTPAKAGIYSFFLFCSLIFPIAISFATPPVSIDLKYDLDKGSLHVEAIHPSFNLDKSYVRLMNVYVNDQEISTLNYYRQNDDNKFTDDVPLTAQAGDVIKVELFCSLGGDMSKELTVAKPGSSQPDQNADVGLRPQNDERRE